MLYIKVAFATRSAITLYLSGSMGLLETTSGTRSEGGNLNPNSVTSPGVLGTMLGVSRTMLGVSRTVSVLDGIGISGHSIVSVFITNDMPYCF